jgi:hypothetical protein
VWGSKLSTKKVLLHCDNESVVNIVNSGTSKCRDLMCLVRVLHTICVENNFEVRLVHIAGVENIGADKLSRLEVLGFFKAFPGIYDRDPIPLGRPQILKSGEIAVDFVVRA